VAKLIDNNCAGFCGILCSPDALDSKTQYSVEQMKCTALKEDQFWLLFDPNEVLLFLKNSSVALF